MRLCIYIKIKRRLLLGRKAMTNLDSILKSRDITLPTKVHLVKAMEKAMAPHSSILAWKIPWTEDPGGPRSMGSLRVGHDWATLLSLFTFMHWRRKWQPTSVFLPGESQGRGSLVAAVYAVAQSRTRLKWLSSQSYGFSSGHVCVWELNYKESWAPKNWCFWTVVLEKTLESPLDYKEIQLVHPRGNQSWIYIGRTDAEAETPVLWPPDAKNWLIGKDPDAGKDWRWEEKGTTEDEMVGQHHWLDGHKFEQIPGDGKRTEEPKVLPSMALQRVERDGATEQQRFVLNLKRSGIYKVPSLKPDSQHCSWVTRSQGADD